MPNKGYCPNCKKWVQTKENGRCPYCNRKTLLAMSITDPEKIRKFIKVRKEFENHEEEIIKMIAESGALLEGHFILEDN